MTNPTFHIAVHTQNPDGATSAPYVPLSCAQAPEELTSGSLVMPDQRSTTDQLRDLIKFANAHGMYDAADVIARIVEEKP